MGSGTQPSTQNVTSTSTTQLPTWAQPYALTALQRGQELADRPYSSFGNAVAPLDPLHQTGIDIATLRATQGAPDINQARQLFRSTAAGDYLSPATNPYLEQTYNRAARGVTDQYRNATAPAMLAQGARARSLGNTGFQEYMDQGRYALGENLGNLATDIYGGNYQNERARQNATLGLAPAFAGMDYQDAQALYGAGDIRRAVGQDQLSQAYQEYERSRMQPYVGQDVFLNSLRGAAGGQGTQTQSNPYFAPNPAVGALGGGLAGYQAGTALGANPWLTALAGGLLGGIF